MAGKTLTRTRRPLRYWLSPSPDSKKSRILGLELVYGDCMNDILELRELVVTLAAVIAADGTEIPDPLKIPPAPSTGRLRHLQVAR